MDTYADYKEMKYVKRDSCCVCGKKHGEAIINLPDFPITEVYVDEIIKEKIGVIDQALHFCSSCSHAQLENVISAELLYGNENTYSFRTSLSLSGQKTSLFFKQFFLKNKRKEVYNNIVEVGCNDLFLLNSLSDYGKSLVGIDPILRNTEGIKKMDNISVIGDFYENVSLDEKPDVIICKDVIEHVSNPRKVIETMIMKSSEDVDFFVQVPILDTIVEDLRFDQVFHQHLNYFSISSFEFLLKELGCTLIDYTINYDHWGAAIFYFRKGNESIEISIPSLNKYTILKCYSFFKNSMETTKNQIEFLNKYKVYGYGAALMLPVIFYYLGIESSSIDSIIDDDDNKVGRTYLNLPVKIQSIHEISDIEESVVLITAISSKINTRLILEKLFKIKPRYIITPMHSL